MTTLQHPEATTLATTALLETQAVDNYVLATRVVHRAETLLAAAEGYPGAIAHIEAGIAAALALTTQSSWADVRRARRHLDTAQAELEEAGYRLR